MEFTEKLENYAEMSKKMKKLKLDHLSMMQNLLDF
jgi:hypothetical protein